MNGITAVYKIRIRQSTSYHGCRVLTSFSSFVHPDRTVQRCDYRESLLSSWSRNRFILILLFHSFFARNPRQFAVYFVSFILSFTENLYGKAFRVRTKLFSCLTVWSMLFSTLKIMWLLLKITSL